MEGGRADPWDREEDHRRHGRVRRADQHEERGGGGAEQEEHPALAAIAFEPPHPEPDAEVDEPDREHAVADERLERERAHARRERLERDLELSAVGLAHPIRVRSAFDEVRAAAAQPQRGALAVHGDQPVARRKAGRSGGGRDVVDHVSPRRARERERRAGRDRGLEAGAYARQQGQERPRDRSGGGRLPKAGRRLRGQSSSGAGVGGYYRLLTPRPAPRKKGAADEPSGPRAT